MRYASLTGRLQDLGGDRWAVHALARRMKAEGQRVIELTVGEPDVPVPEALRAAARAGIDAGRLGYSNGRGEPALLAALAARYSRRSGRVIGPANLIALPGTQTALYAVMQALLDPGDEVVVGDPMYATYAGVIAATGARLVPVALRPENGFRLAAADVAAAIGPRTRVLFLNSPHNPTGAVLRPREVQELGALARAHDLWIVSDEVYEELVFPGATFASPFDRPDLAERVIVTSSISKSHAAPGFRSGWVVGPAEFCARLLPLAEAMLFGNQPFIADMTALAVAAPSPVAPEMARRFARRAALIARHLDGVLGLRVPMPEAGMFAMLDLRALGLSGDEFAGRLLRERLVAVMPGESFGAGLAGWVRVSLTQSDDLIEEACRRILALAGEIKGSAT
ncbi:MAG: pyridoxal phosphate-dependent aminotransferase [Paracoccaceae bacterium]